jgi:hypothetical protein
MGQAIEYDTNDARLYFMQPRWFTKVLSEQSKLEIDIKSLAGVTVEKILHEKARNSEAVWLYFNLAEPAKNIETLAKDVRDNYYIRLGYRGIGGGKSNSEPNSGSSLISEFTTEDWVPPLSSGQIETLMKTYLEGTHARWSKLVSQEILSWNRLNFERFKSQFKVRCVKYHGAVVGMICLMESGAEETEYITWFWLSREISKELKEHVRENLKSVLYTNKIYRAVVAGFNVPSINFCESTRYQIEWVSVLLAD